MNPHGTLVERARSGTWGGFGVWALFGAAAAFGLVILGFLGVLPLLVAVWLLANRPAFRGSAFGALSGAGAVYLYVAFVQRRGPGTVCWHTATASGCDQYLNPWPWLVAGAVLVLVGLIAFARWRRSKS